MKNFSTKLFEDRGPGIKLGFFLRHSHIVCIDLQDHPEKDRMSWRIFSQNFIPTALEEQIHRWMKCYSQKKKSPDLLPLLIPEAPIFTAKVLKFMQNIPFGVTLSYGEVAAKVLKPRAARAIGTICRKNAFLLAIPCHRIIAANSLLGGFAKGLEIKKRLLDFEELLE